MTVQSTRRQPAGPAYHAFLPAALELERTPPARSGRLLIWAIALFCTVAVVWAYLGRIDIVAVAQGKIVPRGQSKLIQPFDRGTVIAIHVLEGQRVKTGDPLISLDATSYEADERQAVGQLRRAQDIWLEEALFKRALDDPDGAGALTRWIAEAGRSLQEPLAAGAAARHHDALTARITEYRARQQSLQQELATAAAQRAQAQALAAKYQRLQPILDERRAAVATLYERRLAARDQYLQLEQQGIELAQNLAAERARVRELEGEAARVRALIAAARSQARHDNLARLGQAEADRDAARQRLRKARQQQRRQTLTAPLDGTVSGLAVHTIGGVVNPAQTLLSLIPEHEPLLIEAYLPNRDIGFVESGQQAAIKVEAFNFTRYGTLPGTLESIAEDSQQDASGALVYPLRIRPQREHIRVGERWVRLSPGMAVTVEIRTGTRRIVDYFLSPLARLHSESLHER